MEKYGVLRGALADRSWTDSKQPLRSGVAGRSGAISEILVRDFAGAKADGCGSFYSGADRSLEILPGGLAAGRGISGRKHLYDPASVSQLVSGYVPGENGGRRSDSGVYFYCAGISVSEERRWKS